MSIMVDTTSVFIFSSRRRHTRYWRDWSSDVCSSDLNNAEIVRGRAIDGHGILLPSRWDVHADLVAGRLVPILPAYCQPADIWAASTVRLSHSAKVRVCVRFLQEQLAHGPFALKQ